jgi:CBS domain-containing protein
MKTTAQDIMSTEVLTIREGTTLEEALKVLINNRITGLPVVNARNEMIGMVSEYDIMVQISEMPHFGSGEKAALDVACKFAPGARAISTTTGLKEIIDLFITLKYRRLPVVDRENKLVGIITRRDIMRLFYYRARLTG